MTRIVVTMVMAVAMAGCATDEGQNTSSLDQDVTTQTCTPTYAPPPKGGYLFCTVHAYNGSTYWVHAATETECTACGVIVNHDLCVEYDYPADLAYCTRNPGPGGGGGGTGDTGGDPCSALGPSCYQEASGRCNCAPAI